MSEKVVVVGRVETELTPAILAEAFWNMSDEDQAEFFYQLAEQTKKTYTDRKRESLCFSDEYGTSQWCSMTRAIEKHSTQAYRMYLSFCAFAFEFYENKPQP